MNKAIGLITTNYANENFGKLAESRPVATVPFGGRYRLVDFPLSNMVHSGIRCVGITTAHSYRSLIDHLAVSYTHLYKFRIETLSGEVLYKADPFAFFAEKRPGTASRLAGPNTLKHRWNDEEWIKMCIRDSFASNSQTYRRKSSSQLIR